MIGRKLSRAAKRLLSSSASRTTGLYLHTSNAPHQAYKCGLPATQKKSSQSSAIDRPLATHKAPPRALAVVLDEPKSQKKLSDCDCKRPLDRPWRPPLHVAEEDEEEMKKKMKKKKKRGPPGPIEFEDLTSKTPVHSDLPFSFRYSYTEIPKVAPVGFQEKFSPFGPGRLDRPWDGQQAVPSSPSCSLSLASSEAISSYTLSDNSVLNMKKSKYSFKGVKLVNPPRPSLSRTGTRKVRSREEVLGELLTVEETKELVENASKHKTRRQINMGRDGLTHNMLIEIQEHWKRQPVARIRCKGVCTVDMNNVLFQLEDKTGGKIIYRLGGTIYLFRGRNFRFKDRPIIPPMLWRPHAPLYPPLIVDAPGGLRVHEANSLRKRGLKIMPLCILSKNGYYGDLVQHVREAFEDDELVRIDCKGLNISDYKRIGAKLRDLVPCYLLSFKKDQVVLWRGKDKNLSPMDSSDSVDAKGANLHRLEDSGNIPVVNGRCEDVSSTENACKGEDDDEDEGAEDIFEAALEDDSSDGEKSGGNLGSHTDEECDTWYSSDFSWTSDEDNAWRA